MSEFSSFRITALLFSLNVFLLITAGSLSAQGVITGRESTELQPLRIEQDFDVDGSLSNPLWQQANGVYLTYQYAPVDTKPAMVETVAKIMYSENFLYVGFWASDPNPSEIRAHITDRDEFESVLDDNVGIIIDPFIDNQNAVQFFVNPRGVQLDAKRSGAVKNTNFDMLWHSAAQINDTGYTAVLKIPFSSFLFPNRNIHNWSIQLMRKYSRDIHHEFAWTHIAQGDPCILCQNGRLTGMTGIKNNNPINIIPYTMGYQASQLKVPGNPASGLKHNRIDGALGGTVTYSPGTNSSLDITINPDFRQVETDATEISVNNTFAVQYPEKRPFFLNNAELFETGDLQSMMKTYIFFSRTINQPWAAAKYTYTTSKASVGFMSAYDRNAPYIVPGLMESSTIEKEIGALSNVLRAKLNIGRKSYIGGTLSTRNHFKDEDLKNTYGSDEDAYNYAGSLDWNLFLGGKYYFEGLAAYSKTKELEIPALYSAGRLFGQSGYDAALNGERFGGSYMTTKFSRKAKFYNFSLSYSSLSPTFQTQNGFITRIDRRTYGTSQQLNYYPDVPWFASGNVSVNTNWRYDFGNVFQERTIHASWSNSLTKQTRISVSRFFLNDEYFRGVLFENMNRTTFDFGIRPTTAFSLSARYEFGKSIYRTLTPELGDGYNYSLSSSLQPTDRLKMDLSYNFSTLSALDNSETYYKGSISRLVGRYSFTHYLFFRLITQYDSFNKQIDVYPMMYYKPNPFTNFYIGVKDNLQHVNQAGPPEVYGYRQVAREFFVKIQFLFQV